MSIIAACYSHFVQLLLADQNDPATLAELQLLDQEKPDFFFHQ